MLAKDCILNYRIFDKRTLKAPRSGELKLVLDNLKNIISGAMECNEEYVAGLVELGEVELDELDDVVAEAVLFKYVNDLEMLLEAAMMDLPEYLMGYVETIEDCG